MSRHTPILSEFGLTVQHKEGQIPEIADTDIEALLLARGEKFTTKFRELANGQTCSESGMYYYDVADILRTMQTGIHKEDWD